MKKKVTVRTIIIAAIAAVCSFFPNVFSVISHRNISYGIFKLSFVEYDSLFWRSGFWAYLGLAGLVTTIILLVLDLCDKGPKPYLAVISSVISSISIACTLLFPADVEVLHNASYLSIEATWLYYVIIALSITTCVLTFLLAKDFFADT